MEKGHEKTAQAENMNGVIGRTISIIVPVHNVAEYLPSCLDSIAAQTYQALDIILVNDGSTDESGAICEQYAKKDARFRVIHQPNKGVAAARNSGLDKALGAYIGWVDPDDRILPNMYERLVGILEETGASIAQCGVLLDTDAETADSPGRGVEVLSGSDVLRSAVHGRLALTLWCNLYDARLWKDLRFLEGYCYEDQMLFPDIAGRCVSLARVAEKLYYYNRRESGIVRQKKTLYHLHSKEKLIDSHICHFSCGNTDPCLAALYMCMLIASYRLTIRENENISAAEAAAHTAKMRSAFRRYFPLAQKSPEYAAMPFVKKVYWRLYALSPIAAEHVVEFVKHHSKKRFRKPG